MNKFRMIYIAGVLWCSFNIGSTLSSCCIHERFGIDDLFILLISALSSAAFIGLIKAEEFLDRLSIIVSGVRLGNATSITIHVVHEEMDSEEEKPIAAASVPDQDEPERCRGCGDDLLPGEKYVCAECDWKGLPT